MDIFVKLLITLTGLFGGNLGLTIIFIGVVSRLLFYPFLKSSYKSIQIQKDLKPKLAEIKKKHGHDRKRHMEEQSRVFKEAGYNPAAGCLGPLVQLVVAIILFNALRSLIDTPGIQNEFLIWNLSKPDLFSVKGIGFALPGLLIILTAIATFLQSKMMLPEPVPVEKSDSKKEVVEKGDLADALASSQGQLVYLFPLIILFTGRLFPAGLALYWLVSTIVGLVQQYYISGLGGLKPWLKFLQKN